MAGRCCHGREALVTYGTPSHNSASYSEAPQPTQADLPPPPDTPSRGRRFCSEAPSATRAS